MVVVMVMVRVGRLLLLLLGVHRLHVGRHPRTRDGLTVQVGRTDGSLGSGLVFGSEVRRTLNSYVRTRAESSASNTSTCPVCVSLALLLVLSDRNVVQPPPPAPPSTRTQPPPSLPPLPPQTRLLQLGRVPA